MLGGGGNCDNEVLYTPDASFGWQNTPNLVFRLNFHFIRPSNGSGPYAGDMNNIVQTNVGNLNWFYYDIQQPSIPVSGVQYLTDSRIRFVNAGVYYHDDDDTYDWAYNLPGQICGAEIRDQLGVDVDNVINIFFFQNNWDGSYGCGPSTYMCVNMINCNPVNGENLLSHELGHVLGLGHTFGSCTPSGTSCGDDSYSDTYFPDCNKGWVSCGASSVWQLSCTGTGVTNNIMGYNSCRKYFSPMQMAHMQHSNIATSDKRNYVVCTPHPDNPIIYITQDAIWESSKIINADIVVESGVTLEVHCTLYMSPHVKIIVKQGAKLIVDGGAVTARSGECNTFWQGIQAWGTTNQHQYPENNPTYQALVVLKNGAVVEHALTGVETGNPDNSTMNGGVLEVSGSPTQVAATFLNCQRGVVIKNYQNFDPNTAQNRPNLSSFQYADLIVNDDYRGGGNFRQHVLLQNVDGLYFTACDFRNEQTTISQSAKLGQGILAVNASFYVSGGCEGPPVICENGSGVAIPPCPPELAHPSRFIGLDFGIQAMGTGSSGRTFTVYACSFENNVGGIFTSGVNNFSILRNTFITGNRTVNLTSPYELGWQGHHRAIYNYTGRGFRIEENSFQKDPATAPGVEVEGPVNGFTGAYNVQVYKNSAKEMDHAFVAEGNCLDYGNDPTGTGLGFYCNTNSDNVGRDFTVRMPHLDIPATDHSIKLYQGSPGKSAGNSFTPTQNGAYPYFNYHNEAERLPITYFWHTPPGELNPGSYNAPWVAKYQTISPQRSCPTRITCPGGVVELLAPQIETEQAAYLDLLYVYESLIDGGDPEELQQTIMTTWPNDAWELRNELMAKSPYLSVATLKETAVKDILPEAMLLEVCVANPDATKQDGFVEWIEFEAPNPLPHYMVETIMASWDETTFRTSLEASMAQHKGEMDQMNDQLIIALRNDSLSIPLDSVLVRWQANTSLGARYGEAQTLMELGRYAEATALINSLEGGYTLKERDAEERQDMIALIDVLSTAETSGQDLIALDESDLQVLRITAEGLVNQAAIWAQNILCFGYQECYAPVTGGSMTTKSLPYAATEGTDGAPHQLRVYPSPAKNWVTFEHVLTGIPDHPFVLVRDITGREIAKLPIAATQLVWDTRKQPPGTYLVELYNGGSLTDTQRLILQP